MTNNSQYTLEGVLENTYKLIDKNAYNVVGFIPDAHRAVDAIEELGYRLSTQAKGKDVYVVLQDIDEKKDRLELFQKAGYQDPQSAVINYTSNKLETDREKELFQYLTTIDMNGGVENYLQMLTQHYGLDKTQQQQFWNQYKQATQQAKELNLEEKLKQIQTKNQNEIQSIAQISQLQLMAYDRAISQYNLSLVAKKVKELNQKLKFQGYGEVKLIVGGGNHDTIYDSSVLKHLLGGNYVHDVNDLTGAIELGEGKDKVTFQVAGNVYGITQRSDSLIYHPQILAQLYPHMYTGEEAIVQDYNPKQKVSLEDAMKSTEYQRITKGGKENQTLDFLLTHEEFGVKMGYEQKQSPYPNLDNLGLIYLTQNNLKKDAKGFVDVYSGHLHSPAEKKDYAWMQNKHRAYAYMIGSNGGKIVEDLPNKHPKLEYDMKKLEEITIMELSELAKAYGIDLSIFGKKTDDENSQDSKKAA